MPPQTHGRQLVTQPTDYVKGKPCAPTGKFPWFICVTTLAVPFIMVLIWAVSLGNRLDAVAQDVADNGAAISTTPSTFVPRAEIDAKLQSIQLQVGYVQANVEALKEQSERQTAEIIRRIERADRVPQ